MNSWLSVYGAGLATLVALWIVWSELRNGPRLQLIVEPDAEAVARNLDPALHLAIRITNTGGRPTTVVGLRVDDWNSSRRFGRPHTTSVTYSSPDEGSARHPLRPGDEWRTKVALDRTVFDPTHKQHPFLAAVASHRKRPYRTQLLLGPMVAVEPAGTQAIIG